MSAAEAHNKGGQSRIFDDFDLTDIDDLYYSGEALGDFRARRRDSG